MIRISLKNNKTLVVLLSCFVVMAAGCDMFKKQQPAPAPQAPKQAQPVVLPAAGIQKQVSSAKLPPVQANQFDFSTKKDPFKPFVSVRTATSGDQKRAAGRDALPIHSFDVSQFRLIGIVADARGNKAMVVDPAGKAYVLRTGMTIGKNEGKITQIAMNGVDVVEQFRDDNGKIRKETIRIPLLRKP